MKPVLDTLFVLLLVAAIFGVIHGAYIFFR